MVVIWRIDVETWARWRDLKSMDSAYIYIFHHRCNDVIFWCYVRMCSEFTSLSLDFGVFWYIIILYIISYIKFLDIACVMCIIS